MDEEVSEMAPEATVAAQVVPRAGWLVEGRRVAFFRTPRWERLSGSNRTLAVLVLAHYLMLLVWQRAMLDGHPGFAWEAVFSGWFSVALGLWVCWTVLGSRQAGSPGTAHLPLVFSLWCAVSLVCCVISGLALWLLKLGFGAPEDWPLTEQWLVWLAPMVWLALAQVRLLWRLGEGWRTRFSVLVLTSASVAVSGWLAPVQFWWPNPDIDATRIKRLELTQEVVDTQPRLLTQALDSMKAQRPGKVDVFALTYAPYSTQDVFMHESAVVAKTMRERFDTGGHTVQLVVNPASATTLPWATPANLHRSIQRMAALMDRDEDVFFIHLTSHGGADGKLAVDTWPLQSEPVTPQLLKAWLDEAGIRWRVISVSACYSGSWIAPLAGDGTLVMTAADATHTSYGCGSRSPLTFFGQAMYVEALQQTWNFKAAHARARELIQQREVAAGKTDGYSNPQLSEGVGIAQQLLRLQAELALR